MLAMVLALSIAALPDTTYADEPDIYHHQTLGGSAYARYSSCPDWDAIGSGDVCVDTYLIAGEFRVNGATSEHPGTENSRLQLIQFEYTVDDYGYYQFLSSAYGSTHSLSYQHHRTLSGATVDAVVPVNRCSEGGACGEEKVRLEAAWTGVGERHHDTYTLNWNSRDGYGVIHSTSTGLFRDATATLEINGNPVEGINQKGILEESGSGDFFLHNNHPHLDGD